MSCLALSCFSGKVQVSHQSLVTPATQGISFTMLEVIWGIIVTCEQQDLIPQWLWLPWGHSPMADITFLTSDEITHSMLLAKGIERRGSI